MEANLKQTNDLRRALSRWDGRLRLQHSLQWLPRGLFFGLLAAALLALVARIWPLLPTWQVLRLGLILAAAGMLIALLVVWVWRRRPLDLARRFDLLFGLKERISTALEIEAGALPVESETLARAQLDQAVHAVATVQPAERISLRGDLRAWLASGIALGVFVLLIILLFPSSRGLHGDYFHL